MKVEEYIDESGRNNYAAWFGELAPAAAAKAATAVARMAAGNTSGLKGLGAGLAEWRIDWGPGIRIYLHQEGGEIIVLMGGSDKGDQAAEIAKAAGLVTEYKARKKKEQEAEKAKKNKGLKARKK